MTSSFDLPQVNVARLAADIESPHLQSLVDALDHVTAEAEGSSGFRWRLPSDNGNATDVVAFQWDRSPADSGIIVNLSVGRIRSRCHRSSSVATT